MKTIDQKLEDYFSTRLEYSYTNDFKKYLQDNECFIAGSFITEDDAGDIDIYCKYSPEKIAKKDDIADLLQSFAYIERHHIHASYYTDNVKYIKTFTKLMPPWIQGKPNIKKIQVMYCDEPLWTIANFDLTCCINVYNGDKIFYKHPENYLQDANEKICYFNTDIKYTPGQLKTHRKRLAKYTKRGYTIKNYSVYTPTVYANMKCWFASDLPEYKKSHVIDIKDNKPLISLDKGLPVYSKSDAYAKGTFGINKKLLRQRQVKMIGTIGVFLMLLFVLVIGYLSVSYKDQLLKYIWNNIVV